MNVSPELVRARLDDLQRAMEQRRLVCLAATAPVRRPLAPAVARTIRSLPSRALAWFSRSQLGPSHPSERD